MPRRFDAGPAVALLGAIILVVALFLDWFDPGVTAWAAFESLDLVLLGLAAAIVWAALRPQGVQGQLMLVAGLGAFLVVVVQVIQPPLPLDAAGAGPRLGAWLGLLGTALAVLGSMAVVTAISIQVDVQGRDGRRRARAVDRRTPSEPREDEEDDEDELPPSPQRRPAAAQRPAAGGSGSLFSRPARDAPRDEPVPTQSEPQPTQAFRAFDDDEDAADPDRDPPTRR